MIASVQLLLGLISASKNLALVPVDTITGPSHGAPWGQGTNISGSTRGSLDMNVCYMAYSVRGAGSYAVFQPQQTAIG